MQPPIDPYDDPFGLESFPNEPSWARAREPVDGAIGSSADNSGPRARQPIAAGHGAAF